MAQTIKEFAVKLSVDTSSITKSTSKLNTALTQTRDLFKSIFGNTSGIEKVGNAINQTLTEEMEKLNQKFRDQAQVREQMMRTELKTVQKGTREETKLRNQAIKDIEGRRREFNKRMAQAEKQRVKESVKAVKDAQKAFQQASGQFKTDIISIETDEPIKDIQALGKALQSSQTDIKERTNRQLKNLDSQRAEDIKKGERNLIQIVKDGERRQTDALKAAAQQRKRAAGGNSEIIEQIERELQKELLRVEKEGIARRAAIRRTATQRREDAPRERRTGRIGRGGAIISETTGDLARQSTAQFGALGGVLTKLGPAGLIAGGAIAGLVGIFGSAAKANANFTDGIAKIKTLMTDEQAMNLDVPLAQLRTTATQTGQEINGLQDAMFNVISATPSLTGNLSAAANIVDKASKTAVGLGASTNEVAQAASNLGNALGLPLEKAENVDNIMDILSNTMKQGVIPNASILATNISKTAPLMGFLFENTNEAAKSIGSLTAIMTANGVRVEESQTQIKSLFKELSDPKKQAALFAKGLRGISKETGKIDDIREVFKSMAEDVKGFDQVFSRAEAKNALKIFTKESGDAFSDMLGTFDNAGGTAKFMFETMAKTGKNTSERISASMNDLKISIGGGVNQIAQDTKGLIADSLSFVADLFKSEEQVFLESQAKMDKASQNVKVFNDLIKSTGDEIANIDALIASGRADETAGLIAQEIQNIGNAANQFKDDFPFIAADIQKIINAPGEKTLRTIILLNEQIEKAQGLAQAEQLVTSFAASEAAIGALGERFDEIRSKVVGGFAGGNFFSEMLGVDEAAAGSFGADILEQVKTVGGLINVEIDNLLAERDSLDLESADGAERSREIKTELMELSQRQQEANVAELEIGTSIATELDRQLTIARQLAESRHETFDIQQGIKDATEAAAFAHNLEGESLALINQLGNERIATELEIAGKTEELVAFKELEKTTEVAHLAVRQAGLDLTTAEGQAESDKITQQIESLRVERDSISAQEEKNALVKEEADETAKLADEEKKRASDIQKLVDANRKVTEEKVNQSQVGQMLTQLIQQELGTKKLVAAEEIKGLQVIKTKIDAQGESLKIEVAKLGVSAKALQAQIAIAAAAGEATGQQSKVLSGLLDQIQTLNNQLGVMQAASAGIDKKILGLKAGQTTRDAFGKIGGGKETNEIKKATKELSGLAQEEARQKKRLVRQQELNAAQDQKNAASRQSAEQTVAIKHAGNLRVAEELSKRNQAKQDKQIKAQTDAQKRQIAINNENLALQEERIKAEQKFVDDILAFRDKIEQQFAGQRDKTFNNIKTITDRFRSTADIILESSKTIRDNFNQFSEGVQREVGKVSESFAGLRRKNQEANRKAQTALGNALGSATSNIPGAGKGLQKGIFDKIIKEATMESGIVSARLLEQGLKEFAESKTVGGKKAPITLSNESQNALDKAVSELARSNVTLGRGAKLQFTSINELLERQGKQTIDTIDAFEDLDRTIQDSKSKEANATPKGRKLEEKDLKAAAELGELAKIFDGAAKEFDKLTERFAKAKTSEELSKIALEYDRLVNDFDKSGASAEELFARFNKSITDNAANLELLTDEQQGLINGRLELLRREFDFQQKSAAIQRINIELIAKANELEKERAKVFGAVDKTLEQMEQNQIDALDPIGKINHEYTQINQKIAKSITLIGKQIKANISLANSEKSKVEAAEGLLKSHKEDLANLKEQLKTDSPEAAKATSQQIEALNVEIKNETDRLNEASAALDVQTGKLNENTEAKKQAKQAETEANKQKQEAVDTQNIEDAKAAIDSLDPSNLINFAEGVGDAIKGIKKLNELKQFGSGLEGVAKVIEGTANAVESAGQLTEETITGIIDATDKFKSGDVGGGTQAVADITKKIGNVLLNSAIPPLQIAGAVMLGIGVITGLVGKIVSAIKGQEKDSKQIAEEKSAVLDQQVKAYESQLEIVSTLAGLEDESVDTAKERLEALREANAELVESNELARQLSELTNKELAAEKDKTNEQIGQIDNTLKLLENAEDLNLVERFKLLFTLGFDKGIAVTKGELAEIRSDLEAEKIGFEDELKVIDLTIGFRSQEFEEIRNRINEEVSSLDFVIQANIGAGELDDALEGVRKQSEKLQPIAEKAFDFAGVSVDLTGMSAEQIEAFKATLDDVEFPPGTQEDIDRYIESLRKSTTVIDETFNKQIDLIRARQSAEKITQEEADDQVLSILEDQLVLLIEQGAAEMDILAVEAEILALKNAQTEEDQAQNQALSEAVRKRQELLNIIRQESQGGTLSTEQRGQLAESERTIVSELRASGASEEEIQSFLGSLPAFADGGIAQETGLALVTKGEPIIPINRLKEIDEQFRAMGELFSMSNPIVSGDNELTRQISTIILQKEAQSISKSINISIGDIVNNIDVGSGNATDIIQKIQGMSAENILNIVQKGLDQDKIDLREKIT